MDLAARLRAGRDRLVADRSLRGVAFGEALADLCDATIAEAATDLTVKGSWAVVAQGSYARRELCPGSDLDVVFLHSGGVRGAAAGGVVGSLWYPFWDAGVVLGHASRSVKEALALATDDLDALTALLDLRVVAGDAAFAEGVRDRARALARKRRDRVVTALHEAASARYVRPGPVAEMLEPDLKEGAGGLRDVHALTWAGWAVGGAAGPGGLDALVRVEVVGPADVAVLAAASGHLLDLRVALHRVTGGRSDVLLLQDQDAVAEMMGVRDADRMLRSLADTSRQVGWISREAFDRLAASGRRARPQSAPVDLGGGIVRIGGRVALAADAPVTVSTALRLAAAAAEAAVPVDRDSLTRLGEIDGDVPWTADDRAAFVRLLRAGRRLVAVFEALDHVGALVRLFPEWEHVRARPQRNAYHRFTVDRHLLETVVACDAILDGETFDGVVARRVRPDLLLLAALLHDIGKGLPGDHSEVGAARAVAFVRRIGLDEHGVRVVEWVVRNHLLIADTATRRDLSDPGTIVRFGRTIGDTERLDLLYALTIGDSQATGPSAWGAGKAQLCRQLFVETDTLLEDGVVGERLAAERRDALTRHAGLLEAGELAVEWRNGPDGTLECTVAARDRRGLLANVAGVLTLVGFDIRSASAYGDADSGMALEVYRGVDQFGRLDDAGRRDFVTMLRSALDGVLPLRERVRERVHRYRSTAPTVDRSVTVVVDPDASASATVIEVMAPDEVGLLASVAAVLADLDVDVSAALVSTTDTRAVDVFYIRDAQGAKPTDPKLLQRIRATLVARLTTDFVLPAPR